MEPSETIERPEHVEPVLEAMCELARAATGKPVAVWVKDPLGDTILPRGHAGLEPRAFAEAVARVADGSLIAEVLASAHDKTLADVRGDAVLKHCRPLGREERLGMLASPSAWRSETLAVVGLFFVSEEDITASDRHHLARLSTLAGEHAGRVRRAQLLARGARTIAQSPDLSEAMQVIAATARSLTGCDATGIWLLDSHTGEFVLGGHSGPPDWCSERPRSQTGLSRLILDEGRSIRIDDASGDKRVRKAQVRAGLGSLVGVPVQREGQTIGVLFANSRERNRFTVGDVYMLETVAAQVSAGLGWAQRLLAPMDDVDQAIARLFTVEETLRALCERIQEEMGFDYAAVQLVRPLERTIETVYSTGAMEWTGIAKHPMDTDKELRDIQVDIVRSHPRRIEVIRGLDPRFDTWIYEHAHHERYVRAWVPMLIVLDESGRLVRDWWRHAHWQEGTKEPLPNDGWRYTLELEEIEERCAVVHPLGTLDAGYKDPDRTITPDEARRLANLVSEGALEVRSTQLAHVLESVADGSRRILRADAASLHFVHAPNPTRPEGFAYEVFTGERGLRFSHRADPGHHGLGREAIQCGLPRFIPDQGRGDGEDAVKGLAPKLYDQRVKAIAAFPLVVDGRESILYVYFHTAHRFTEDEIRWGEVFARRAEAAIRDATRVLQSRDQTRQIANMHSIARALVTNADHRRLLADIAGYTANLLGADLVTIHEYLKSERRFSLPPARAGRPFDPHAAAAPIPEKLTQSIMQGDVVWGEDCTRETTGDAAGDEHGLSVPERIQSCILYPLREPAETVGAMFVGYCAPRRFTPDERQLLVPTLAAAAAITIGAARSKRQIEQDLSQRTKERDALYRVDRAIVTGAPDLRKVLDLILQEAMEITGAQTGTIFRYDRWQKVLDSIAGHGLPNSIPPLRLGLDEGIVGLAARERKTKLVPDVRDPEWQGIYHEVIPDTRAELAVPLQDAEDLWGVLNVEHPSPGKLDQDARALLETFAIQAMIAVHSVNLFERLERQIRPLRSLSVVYSRMQDPRRDIDTVLRLLLTGVTAGPGLSFSRAMLFLNERDAIWLNGRMAIGARTREEAQATWDRLEEEEHRLDAGGRDVLGWLLDEAESLSKDLREEKKQDSPLSQAVRRQSFSIEELGGALRRCLTERRSVIVGDEEPDPFRDILWEIEDVRGEDRPFACVPLLGQDTTEGILVADYRFKMCEREIAEQDLISLDAYAGVATMAIENVRLRRRLEREREDAWREFASKASHSIGNRIALAEGPLDRLRASLSASGETLGLLDRLQGGLDSAKGLLRRFRDLLNPAEPELEPLDLAEVLVQVEEENRDRLRGIPLRIDPGQESMVFRGDRLLITDAFAELITNALEAMETDEVARRWIAIRVPRKQVGDKLCVEVVNPGRGVPQERKRAIFEPFSSTKGRNRGLGLAAIKQSLKSQGAEIEEAGTPGQDTRFVMRFPLSSHALMESKENGRHD